MTLVREFNLYLTAGRSIPLVINVNQFDSGEEWHFTLFKEDGTQYIPSTGAIVGIKSDGLGIINSGTVVDGKVVINETQQMTAAVGKATFELTIDSGTHGTANFVVLVEEKPGNNADLSDSDISLIQEALNAVSPLPTGGTVGQVLTKTAQGSAWSDAGTPTQEQVAEAVSDWADENITVETGVVIDTSLSVAGAAADAKKTGDEISDLKSQISQSSGLTDDIKQALETLLEHVAYIDGDGQTYLDALHSAMNPLPTLSYITAVYTQSGTVYEGASLDSLKADLVVTALWSDSSTSTVASADYTLSGTLVVGTSTVTVSYGGKTTTFNVTVTQAVSLYPFENGTHTFSNGHYVTVTDGHIVYGELVSASSVSMIANVSSLSKNTTTANDTANNTSATEKMFDVRAGSVITWEITPLQIYYSNSTQGGKTTNLSIRDESATIVAMLGSTNPKYNTLSVGTPITGSYTAQSDVEVWCIGLWMEKSGNQSVYAQFDVKIYVDGDRYV